MLKKRSKIKIDINNEGYVRNTQCLCNFNVNSAGDSPIKGLVTSRKCT